MTTFDVRAPQVYRHLANVIKVDQGLPNSIITVSGVEQAYANTSEI